MDKNEVFSYLVENINSIVISYQGGSQTAKLMIDKDTFRQYGWNLPYEKGIDLKVTIKIDFYKVPILSFAKAALEGFIGGREIYKPASITKKEIYKESDVDSFIDDFIGYINRSKHYQAKIK